MSSRSDPGEAKSPEALAWRALSDTLREVAGRVEGGDAPDDPRARAEGFRYLARFLASGLAVCVNHDDPDYPSFGRMIDYARPWGLDNPDCLYLYAPLRGGAVYRVWGRRGSAHWFDVQVNFGHFASGDIGSWGTLASRSGFELEVGADGELELWIGGEARAGNWLPSAPNAEFLLVRQLFDDWERERPADLLIERVGAEWPIPPPSEAFVASRLEKLARWMDRGGALWDKLSRAYLAMPENSLVVHMPEDAGARAGAGGQAYGMGNFHCEPGEAVVIELDATPCHYWSVSLANRWWEAIEYASRQSSLNGAQARRDADGRVRCVVSHADPGVPNWLDPAGHARGSLAARWVLPEAKPGARFQRLPAAELRRALPADTPQVGPGERAASLERRRHALLHRFRR